jgi:imidazole glycerol phosphate synthase subunit HisF
MLFFGWQRTITLRRCRTDILLTSIERDGMRQGFDLLLIHSVLRLGPFQGPGS